MLHRSRRRWCPSAPMLVGVLALAACTDEGTETVYSRTHDDITTSTLACRIGKAGWNSPFTADGL